MSREISQGSVIITTEGTHAHVVIDPEVVPGRAVASQIIQEDPPLLGYPGTLCHDVIKTVMPSRWSQAKVRDGLEKSGRHPAGDPLLTQMLKDGKRRGKRNL